MGEGSTGGSGGGSTAGNKGGGTGVPQGTGGSTGWSKGEYGKEYGREYLGTGGWRLSTGGVLGVRKGVQEYGREREGAGLCVWVILILRDTRVAAQHAQDSAVGTNLSAACWGPHATTSHSPVRDWWNGSYPH